jgi:hypothetical protein
VLPVDHVEALAKEHRGSVILKYLKNRKAWDAAVRRKATSRLTLKALNKYFVKCNLAALDFDELDPVIIPRDKAKSDRGETTGGGSTAAPLGAVILPADAWATIKTYYLARSPEEAFAYAMVYLREGNRQQRVEAARSLIYLAAREGNFARLRRAVGILYKLVEGEGVRLSDVERVATTSDLAKALMEHLRRASANALIDKLEEVVDHKRVALPAHIRGSVLRGIGLYYHLGGNHRRGLKRFIEAQECGDTTLDSQAGNIGCQALCLQGLGVDEKGIERAWITYAELVNQSLPRE